MHKKIMAIIIGAMFLAPVTDNFCLSANAADEAPAKPKKKVAKKPIYSNKIAPALKVAAANEEPILAFILKADCQKSKFIEQKLIKFQPFYKEFAPKNVVLFKIKLKPDGRDKKKVNLKSLKEDEKKFIENFGVNESLSKQLAAKDPKKKLVPSDASNYPAIVAVSPDGTRELFRCPQYDEQGGMAVWVSLMVDMLRTKGIEPVITPKLEKILEDPMKFAPKKK